MSTKLKLRAGASVNSKNLASLASISSWRDKFSKNFYANVQKAFIKISKKNRNRYVILDNSRDNTLIDAEIYNKIKKALN